MEPKQAASIEGLLAEARWLEGLARALVGEREEARDLVQEVWTRTLERPPAEVDRPRAWLARVLRNALISRRRAGQSRRGREGTAAPEHAPGTDDIVARAEAQRRLVEAVLGLDEPLRRTLLLHYFDGLTSAEIARRQGVPDSTVRTRLAQALELLRVRLGRSRTEWRTGLGLIACAQRQAERATLHPGVKAALWIGAGALAGWWLFDGVLQAPRVSTEGALASKTSTADPVALEGFHSAREEADSEAPGTLREPPTAPELARLRIVADLVAEGSETPIAGVEIRLTDCVVATGEANGHVDQEFVLHANAPRALRRQVELSLAGRVSTRFLAAAPGWTPRDVELDGRLQGSVHLGLLLLRPAGEARGIVVDGDGRPVPHAKVTWRAGERSPLADEAPWGWTIEERWRGATPECLSDAEGRFHLLGVPFEAGFLQASSSGKGWGYGPVFRSREGETPEFSMELPPYPGFVAPIDGVVLDPAGEPLAWAKVQVTGEGRQDLEADEHGRFEGVWLEPGPIALLASDAEQRYTPVLLDCPDVSAARGLTLQLAPAVPMTIELRSESGAAVSGATVSGHWSTAQDLGWEVGGDIDARLTDDEGRVEVVRPAGSIVLDVEAHGFRARRLEFTPGESLPEPVVIVLEGVRSVRGRLLYAGEPVAGALVHARSSTELAVRSQLVFTGESAFDLQWFTSREARPPTRTDADGRFVVTHTSKNGLTLLVEAPGLPLTALGPFTAPHPEERELEIPAGGVLEGRVLLPLGAHSRGRVVGVCNGFTFARTTPVEPDGTYRFEGLAPGEYQVRVAQGPATEWITFEAYGQPRRGAVVFDCRVESGETARFDVDLRAEGQCHWRARVIRPMGDGERAAGELHRIEPDGGTTLAGQAQLDAEGQFQFRVARPGRYRFLSHIGELDASTRLEHEFELAPGESESTFDIAAGRLHFAQGARPTLGDGAATRWIRVSAESESGWRTTTWVRLDAVGEEGLVVSVPAGVLQLETTAQAFWGERTAWTPAGELRLESGTTLDPFAAR